MLPLSVIKDWVNYFFAYNRLNSQVHNLRAALPKSGLSKTLPFNPTNSRVLTEQHMNLRKIH